MRKDLEAWRGAKFTEADFGPGGFDVRNLLGVPCTLTIVHSERDNNTYANLAGIGKAMKGMNTPDAVNPPVYFTLDPDGFDQTVFDGLSDKLKDFIRATPEFRRLTNGNEYGKQTGADERDPARDAKLENTSYDERSPPPANFHEDDVPFNMEWRG
jgi:hypothetical protein